jgi:uncharacterized membrane protein YphA (DoxX/SURF4 family)
MPMPGVVLWSYLVFGVVLVVWLVVTVRRGDWAKARGLDKLILLGPPFYAAPLAAFGSEHFTRIDLIASIVPVFMPWPRFWTYLVGACFVAAGLSLVTGIRTRLAASLLALTFFLFVALMDFPAWVDGSFNRFAGALALRELAFSGGALALAATLTPGARGAKMATVARYFIAIPVVVYAVEQLLHGSHVPGVPLNRLTPDYIPVRVFWTYLAAAVYAVAGVLLLLGKKTRASATWIAEAVLLMVLVVYVPIAVVERASIDTGFNFLADTLMFCGAVLLLAGAMPREAGAPAKATVRSSAAV